MALYPHINYLLFYLPINHHKHLWACTTMSLHVLIITIET
jgi:hypothetical protein